MDKMIKIEEPHRTILLSKERISEIIYSSSSMSIMMNNGHIYSTTNKNEINDILNGFVYKN